MQDRDAILAMLRATFVELFELDPERITPDARLYDELEIDSIDTIDLMERLRRLTGRKIDSEHFRSVRTVSDLVDTIHQLVNES
jgi:acyl carrier protein